VSAIYPSVFWGCRRKRIKPYFFHFTSLLLIKFWNLNLSPWWTLKCINSYFFVFPQTIRKFCSGLWFLNCFLIWLIFWCFYDFSLNRIEKWFFIKALKPWLFTFGWINKTSYFWRGWLLQSTLSVFLIVISIAFLLKRLHLFFMINFSCFSYIFFIPFNLLGIELLLNILLWLHFLMCLSNRSSHASTFLCNIWFWPFFKIHQLFIPWN